MMTSSVFSQFYDVIEDVKPFVERYLPDKAHELFESSRQKVNEQTLTIQMYGAYNAGKSTLINVLLGKNVASVGEIPTTDRIDEFNWNGYKLLDSPGVNAPIEHEEVTLAQLEKTDLIVFVIRQDDQDVVDIYNRIFACLLKHKHVFIVLNYNGLNPNSTGEGSVNLLIEQINKVLLNESKKYPLKEDFYQNLSILPLNLDIALKGRLGQKQPLLAYSGYDIFITQFYEWVKSYDNERHFVSAIKHYLFQSLLLPVQNIIAEKIPSSSIEQALSLEISKLEKQQNNLLRNATSQLRMIVSAKKKCLFIDLSSVTGDAQAQGIVEDYSLKIEQEFNEWFVSQGEQIQQQLTTSNLILSSNNSLFSEENNGSQFSEHLSKVSIDTLKNQPLVEKGIVEGLKLLRQNKFAFQGIWLKTFEKWAGKIAPVLSVLALFYEVYQAGNSEDEQNKKQQNASMQIHGFVENISNEIIHGLIKSATDIADIIFNDAINQAKNELDSISKNISLIEQDNSNMQRIMSCLDKINID